MVDNHPLPTNTGPTASPTKHTSVLPASSTHLMMWKSHGINGATEAILDQKLAPVMKCPKQKQSSKTTIQLTIFDSVIQHDAETRDQQ
jgi:hypothetical protein